MRTYIVLASRVVDTDVGDHGFVVLGFYETRTAGSARREAVRAYADAVAFDQTVAVSSRYWRAA